MNTKIFRLTLLNLFIAFNLAYAAGPEKLVPRTNTPDEIVAYVERGSKYLLDNGPEAAYRDLMDPDGPYVDGDWYLYINNFDGQIVAHHNKKLVGMTLIHIRDIFGNPFYAELQAIAQGPVGHGWSEFWWPRPGSKEPSRKLAYIMRIPGTELWIGSGTYDFTEETAERVLDKQRSILGLSRD